jgi:hypothetical protein
MNNNIWCRWCGGGVAVVEFMSCGVGECGINDLSELTDTITNSFVPDPDMALTMTGCRAIARFDLTSSTHSFTVIGHVVA